MTPETRYMMANARLAALADVQSWTAQDLSDVFALTAPGVPFEEWMRRIQPATPAPASANLPPEPTPNDPDPQTTETMRMLLGPKGKQLQEMGIISIKENPIA
jgi:hypothetical protein